MIPAGEERLVGEMIGEMRAVKEGMVEMRKENAGDHAAVIRRLDSLSGEIATKAPAKWVEEQHARLDALEKRADEGRGQRAIVIALATLVGAPFIVGLFLLIATRGFG